MNSAVRAYQSVQQKEFRDRLVVEHLECVRHVLGRLITTLPWFVDRENLESAGVLGLIEAANQFEPARGIEFRTYATHRIRGAILDELRRNCPLPQHILQQWSTIRRTWERLGEHVSTDQLCRHTGLTTEEIDDCLTAIRVARPEAWREELAESQVTSHDNSDPSQKLDAEDQQRLLADAIEQLPHRMQILLQLYYTEGLRLSEIGEVMGLSESRVSRLMTHAQLELKQIIQSQINS